MGICRRFSANCRKEARRSLMNFAVLTQIPGLSPRTNICRASGASRFFCGSRVTKCYSHAWCAQQLRLPPAPARAKRTELRLI
jgi:hypothetical protein